MMLRKGVLGIAMLGFFLVFDWTHAEDRFPPTWRGTEKSIHVVWNDWTHTGTSGTEELVSGNADHWTSSGDSSQLDAPEFMGYGIAAIHDSHKGRDGVLETDHNDLSLYIDNYDAIDPAKRFWIQITYYPIDANGAPVEATGVYIITKMENWEGKITYDIPYSSFQHEDSWITVAYAPSIYPGIDEETIGLNFSSDEVYLDEVIVDTKSIVPLVPDMESTEQTIQFSSYDLIDLKCKAEKNSKIWVLLEAPSEYPGVQFARASDRYCKERGRYLFPFNAGADELYYSESYPDIDIDFGLNDFSVFDQLIVKIKKGASPEALETVQTIRFVKK